MLVNLTPDETKVDSLRARAKTLQLKVHLQTDSEYRIETGVYESSFQFNFHITAELFKEKLDCKEYGVADSVEQIKSHHKAEIEDEKDKYVIAITKVYQDKSQAGKGGGWRWHKWGEYIGTHDPKHEYLDDEEFGDDFLFVIVYDLYRVEVSSENR